VWGAVSRHAAVWNEAPRRDVVRDVARLRDAVPNAAQRRAGAPTRLPVWPRVSPARLLLRTPQPVSSADLAHSR
jgi:hypothetical protein